MEEALAFTVEYLMNAVHSESLLWDRGRSCIRRKEGNIAWHRIL